MDLITVVRGNVELDVPAEQKERYKNLGYSVVEKSTGKVIEEALSNDIGVLQSKITELQNENAKLKAENAKLKKSANKSKTSKSED